MELRTVIAWHEAGHAIASHVLGLNLDYAVIASDHGYTVNEYVPNRGSNPPPGYWPRMVIAALAGPAAERQAGSDLRTESDDRLAIDGLILADSRTIRADYAKAQADATALVVEHWRQIEAIAAELLRSDRVERRFVASVC